MSIPDLESACREFITRHRLLESTDHLIVAVSAGIDSMVLLHLLSRIVRDAKVSLSVAHVNHGLRGSESDGDEQFVSRTADTLGIPCHVQADSTGGHAAASGQSLQEWARAVRYEFFETLCRARRRARVATAHNSDDNAETILFNFLRGTGVHGLTGIPVTRSDGLVVRPLLFASREEIRKFALEKHIRYREDSSNATLKYTRNVIRHSLIPDIESAVNPGIRNTLVRTSQLFGGLESYLHAHVERTMKDIVVSESSGEILLDVRRAGTNHPFLLESALHRLSSRISPRGLQYAQVMTLMRLLEAPSGSSCRIAGDLYAYRDRETVTLRRGQLPGPFLFPVDPNDSYQFGDFTFASSFTDESPRDRSSNEEYIDAGLLGRKMALRSWSEGDWFIPIGMGKRKKVSDFFIDEKIPVTRKQRIPLLVSDDSIVWICGHRLDDRFKITPHTRSVLKLSYTPNTL